MTATETDVREAIRAEVADSRRRAGLPPTVHDDTALDRIARVLRK